MNQPLSDEVIGKYERLGCSVTDLAAHYRLPVDSARSLLSAAYIARLQGLSGVLTLDGYCHDETFRYLLHSVEALKRAEADAQPETWPTGSGQFRSVNELGATAGNKG